MKKNLFAFLIMCLTASMLFGCGKSKEDDKDKQIEELNRQIKELEQAQEDTEMKNDIDKEADLGTDNSDNVAENWAIYDCNPKLLDLQPKTVHDPYRQIDLPAIKTFSIQVDDVIFDASEGTLTAQKFVDIFSSGAEANAYTFWINGGEEYSPERLMDNDVVLFVAKNGYGYCAAEFINPESTPISIGDYVSRDFEIYPCRPYIFNGDTNLDYEEALELSSFTDDCEDHILTITSRDPMRELNNYAVKNIWYTGGIRYDGMTYNGEKMKYDSAPAFFESMGLTQMEYVNFVADWDGHYFATSGGLEDAVSVEGYPLVYEWIVDHPRKDDLQVMCAVRFRYIFDLKTQECVRAEIYRTNITSYTQTSSASTEGLVFEKGQNVILD